MINPWNSMTDSNVASVDADYIREYQEITTNENFKLKLDLSPHPWSGNPLQAEALLLMQNPGVDDQDYALEKIPAYKDACRRSLALDGAWPYLMPEFADAVDGGGWWQKRLRKLREESHSDWTSIAKKLAVVQLHGYHSKEWNSFGITIPSQTFTFDLVRDAIKSKKLIVCVRGVKLWRVAVPELGQYENFHAGRYPRSGYLTENNLGGAAWDKLVERMSGQTGNGPDAP